MTEGTNGQRTAAERRVRGFVRRRFGEEALCEPLAGDASDRSFFRIRLPNLSPLVAMIHPEPFDLERLPYALMARFFHEVGADVPQVVSSYPGEGILLVQDLGDETLLEILGRSTDEQRHLLYRQAVRTIVFLQAEGTRSLTPDLPAACAALDRDRLLFELRFFAEHYVGALLGSPLGKGEADRLDEWFESLAGTVAGYESVLCHRDYHSRNLILRGGRLYMVDFQDARMGPYTYDLASLLRDSYAAVPEELVEEMLRFYLDATGRSRAEGGGPPPEFGEQFEMTCLQRNIKALGTFAYQAVVRGNRSYMADVPHTLEMIRFNLMRRGFPEIADLFRGPLLLT